MRAPALLAAFTLPCCAAPPPQTVVVEQFEPVVLSCETVPIANVDLPAARAQTALDWRRVRARFGGALAALPVSYADLDTTDVLIAPLPAGRRVARVDVIDEEDVDVVTLLLTASDRAADHAACAAVLRLARRPRTLAVVLRTDDPPAEQRAY